MITHEDKENLISFIKQRYSFDIGVEVENIFTQQEKITQLLELYRYLWKTPIFETRYTFDEAQKMIDKLEEELK